MRYRRAPILLLVLVLALAPLRIAGAQGFPATPEPGSAPTGVLAEFPIEALPTPHAEVWFLRMGLEPGGSLPAGKEIGPVVMVVESGVLTVVTDQPVTVSRTGEIASPAPMAGSPVTGAFATEMRPGESALVDDGVTVAAMNTTSEPATFLVVYIYAAERETELDENSGEPVGLTQQGISIAPAEFPIGPGTLTIERVVAAPGDTLESDSGHGMGFGGIDLGAIEAGSAAVTFALGSSWMWPSILTEFQERRPIDPGATIELTTGDGYSTYDGSSTWTVTGDEPLILLRVVIIPGS